MNLNVERLFHFGSEKVACFIHTPALAATFESFLLLKAVEKKAGRENGGVFCHVSNRRHGCHMCRSCSFRWTSLAMNDHES